MTNPYYTPTGNPVSNSAGSSSLMRSEFAAIQTAFDKLPVTTANADKLIQVNATGTALEVTTTPTLGTPVSGDATNLTNTIAPQTHAATSKTTPVDADELPLSDSAATFGLKKLTWANLVATLKTYFDSVATTLTNKTLTSPVISGGTINNAVIGGTTPNAGAFTTVSVNGADQGASNAQLTYTIAYALDQAAMANKRVTDATSYQNQTGVASFTQSASSALIRTYATATVSLSKAYPNTDYQVIVEPVSATPALGFEGQITVQSRAVNSFVLQMSGSATACSVRWKVKHNNPEGRVQVVAPTAQ